MKSPLYAASVASTYRQAIDAYLAGGKPYPPEDLERWKRELGLTAARPFTSGFLIDNRGRDLQDIDKMEGQLRADFCGVVKEYHSRQNLLEVEQRSNFGPGEHLEVFLPGGEIFTLDAPVLFDQDLQIIDRARHPRQRVMIPCQRACPENSIIRRTMDHNA